MITTAAIDAFADYPQLSEAKNHRLIRSVKDGDNSAEDKLIRHSGKLLRDALRSLEYYPPSLADDLFQEGQLALRNAARSYRFDLGNPWYSHAFHCARREMLNLLEAPRNRLQSRSQPFATPDSPAMRFCADDSDDELFTIFNRLSIEAHLCVLSQRQREVVAYYYGLVGPDMTLSEISQLMNLTTQRIHQIRNFSLRQLHETMDHCEPLSA